MEQCNIKIYRVLPDIFNIEYNDESLHPEALLYKYGYTPFYGKINRGHLNNVGQHMVEEGKYFFLFPEDALDCVSAIITSETAKMVEYEFPIKKVFNIIGRGEYETSFIGYTLVTELVIKKSFFDGEHLLLSELAQEELLNMAISSIIDTYKFLNKKYDIKSLTEEVKYFINYQRLIASDFELIKSKQITHNMWTIKNDRWGGRTRTEENIDFLQKNGLILDYSKNADETRKEIRKLIRLKEEDDAMSLVRKYKSRAS